MAHNLSHSTAAYKTPLQMSRQNRKPSKKYTLCIFPFNSISRVSVCVWWVSYQAHYLIGPYWNKWSTLVSLTSTLAQSQLITVFNETFTFQSVDNHNLYNEVTQHIAQSIYVNIHPPPLQTTQQLTLNTSLLAFNTVSVPINYQKSECFLLMWSICHLWQWSHAWWLLHWYKGKPSACRLTMAASGCSLPRRVMYLI